MLPEEIASIHLFDNLEPDQQALVAPLFRRVSFLAGESAFAQGDEASEVFVLESGEVAIRFYPSDGGCLKIATIRPGDVFGWSAALGRSRYTSSAICLVRAQALAARGESLRKVMRTDPRLGVLLLERMAQVVASRNESLRAQLIKLFHAETEGDVPWKDSR